MIKKEEINETNVDDYIRQQRSLGQKRFFWSGKALKAFRYFSRAMFADPFIGYPEEYFTIKNPDTENVDVISKPAWKNYPNGFTFMGVKHFKYGRNSQKTFFKII